MTRNIEMQNAATVVPNNEEAVKHSKRQRRYREEIHRGDYFAMIVEKSFPALCRCGISRCSPHPSQNSPLGNNEAQLEEFTMNPRSAPGGVLLSHLKYQFAQFPADPFSAIGFASSGDSPPIEAESGLVPLDYGFWFHNESECSQPDHNFRIVTRTICRTL